MGIPYKIPIRQKRFLTALHMFRLKYILLSLGFGLLKLLKRDDGTFKFGHNRGPATIEG